MELRNLILERWLEVVLESYHKEIKTFCIKERDSFLNPVGSTYRESMGIVLDALFGIFSHERVSFALENMVKIGCLNGYSFDEKKGYIPFLSILIEEIAGYDFEKKVRQKLEKLLRYEEEIYVKTREKLENLRKKPSLVPYERLKING